MVSNLASAAAATSDDVVVCDDHLVLQRKVPSWMLYGALAVALVCALGWMLDQRPLAVVWGSVGEVVGGVATAGALGFAGYEVLRTRQEQSAREEEARLAAARSVGIGSVLHETDLDNEWRVEIELHNAAPYPIESTVVVIPDWGLAAEVDVAAQQGSAVENVLGTVLPGESWKQTITTTFASRWEPAFGELTGIAHVLFVDVWGQAWMRGPGSIRMLDQPPRIC